MFREDLIRSIVTRACESLVCTHWSMLLCPSEVWREWCTAVLFQRMVSQLDQHQIQWVTNMRHKYKDSQTKTSEVWCYLNGNLSGGLDSTHFQWPVHFHLWSSWEISPELLVPTLTQSFQSWERSLLGTFLRNKHPKMSRQQELMTLDLLSQHKWAEWEFIWNVGA